MSGVRPTESIREILLRQVIINWIDRDKKLLGDMWNRGVFEPLRDQFNREIKTIKRQMHSNAVFIVEQTWSQWDVKVTFKHEGKLMENFPFMRQMLEAEAAGRIERLLVN